MTKDEFSIGSHFRTGGGDWRVTDIGTRVVVAIRIKPNQDSKLYNGPPYGVLEQVFDEYDIEDCEPINAPGG